VKRSLILLRHGRTSWNAERRFQGQADPPLDEVGRVQAYEAAALVAAIRPDLLISSDAARAVQTAERIAAATGLALQTDQRFRERSLGHWEGLTREEVASAYPDEYADWLAGKDVSRRGGESREQVATRAVAAYRELPELPVIVVVTHSATAMALSAALLGLDQRVHVLGPLANCHWSELVAENAAGWRLRGHNLGVPGVVVPMPVTVEPGDEPSDADA
jgi:glucosyl-3-phosphoglycerate phosphatase